MMQQALRPRLMGGRTLTALRLANAGVHPRAQTQSWARTAPYSGPPVPQSLTLLANEGRSYPRLRCNNAKRSWARMRSARGDARTLTETAQLGSRKVNVKTCSEMAWPYIPRSLVTRIASQSFAAPMTTASLRDASSGTSVATGRIEMRPIAAKSPSLPSSLRPPG